VRTPDWEDKNLTRKLYCFGESGHSYKAALALELSGLEWEPEYIDFFKGGTRTPEYLALNPMGEAPVLVDGDLVLSQSAVIQDHILDLSDRFAVSDPAEQREVYRWTLWDNHKLSSQVGVLRFLMNFVPEEKRPAEVINWLTGRCAGAFATLERALENRDWIAAATPSMADLTCCSYLYYPEPFTFDRADYPNIDAWLSRISALPGWKHPYDLMPRAFGS
jgi:glutathione S-transferase|tara:strand:- start:854 stop:1513 length:660 start_codon:yes stop_codon:yes gene_type:complete